jgi:hypothetical protein
MRELRTGDDDHPTFEETYRHYPFAPLVAMGLALGAWLHRQQHELVEGAPPASAEETATPPEAHAT